MTFETDLPIAASCYECGKPFTWLDWQDRHEAHAEWCIAQLARVGHECDEREAVHESCCAECEGRKMPEWNRLVRGHWFYPRAVELSAIPALYTTEEQPLGERMVYLHYFASVGSAEFWLIELEPGTGTAFGYVNLGDPQMAEWGGFYLPELEEMTIPGRLLAPGVFAPPLYIERDLEWTPTRVDQCHLPGRDMTLS